MSSGVFFVILNDNANNVILNAVKNLSERSGGRVIVDGRAIPEILRSAQDDKVNGFWWVQVFSLSF